MANMRHHFNALLTKVNPSEDRRCLASQLPGDVRSWLKDHEFETVAPHTRLSGSYGRSTAILDINDVDVLLFLPDEAQDKTPSKVLKDVKSVLDDYPDATTNTNTQRRSVHLEFSNYGLHLDIVPVVAEGGLHEALVVPDRQAASWIASDPLGYSQRLTALNQSNGEKVVPLIKLIKAWRNVQMTYRRPKSYVLEVMTLYAIENGDIVLEDQSYAAVITALFKHVESKYEDLMDKGSEAPRIRDPQISNHYITRGWKRSEFETFMRRIRESSSAAQAAMKAKNDEDASAEWGKVFKDLWPDDEEVKRAARLEASTIIPGVTSITAQGGVMGFTTPAVVRSQQTHYHGDQ